MLDFAKAQLNNSLQVANKKAQEEFLRTFGSLSSRTIDFLKSDDYTELIEAIYTFYIKKGVEALEKTNAFTIDLKDKEQLSLLHDTKLEVRGMKNLYEEMTKLKEAIKEVRII